MQVKVTELQQEEPSLSSVQSPRQELKDTDDNQNETVRNPLVNEALSLFNGKIVEVKYGDGDVGSENNLR